METTHSWNECHVLRNQAWFALPASVPTLHSRSRRHGTQTADDEAMNTNTAPSRRILVVDDEPLIRQTVEMLLHCDGHVVVNAAGGSEALAMFEPGKFDLVFTDYFMPAMK